MRLEQSPASDLLCQPHLTEDTFTRDQTSRDRESQSFSTGALSTEDHPVTSGSIHDTDTKADDNGSLDHEHNYKSNYQKPEQSPTKAVAEKLCRPRACRCRAVIGPILSLHLS